MELKKELRKFGISAFRNIGFLDDKPHQENLTLNYSLDKNYIGDLVILIGPNNAGKSNVLDALECFINNKISNRDKSDTFMNADLRNPLLDLYTIKDGKKYDLKALKAKKSKTKNEDNDLFDYESYVEKYSDNEKMQIIEKVEDLFNH